MNKFVLPLVLVPLFIVSACTPRLFRGMDREARQTIKRDQLYPFNYTRGETETYSMQLNYKDNVINCILLVEPEENGNIRGVCTSVFGSTVLDFYLTEKGMFIYDCMEQLKHKKLLRLLEKDLMTTFFKRFDQASYEAKVWSLRYNSPSAIATEPLVLSKGYSLKGKMGKCHIKTDEIEQHVVAIENSGKLSAANIRFNYAQGNPSPQTVSINHPNLGLSILIEKYETETSN